MTDDVGMEPIDVIVARLVKKMASEAPCRGQFPQHVSAIHGRLSGLCPDLTWRPTVAPCGAARHSADEADLNGGRSLPTVTPAAALREDISAPSDTTVCYTHSLWSASTAACPRAWRSRQDTRPSVATGHPDESKGALQEAAGNGETEGAHHGATDALTSASRAGEETDTVLEFRPRKGPAAEAAGQVGEVTKHEARKREDCLRSFTFEPAAGRHGIRGLRKLG